MPEKPSIAPDIRNYAFVDGNYLRRAYLDTMRKLFPDIHYRALDLERVKDIAQASKVFYYDAIDEEADDANERETYLNKINELKGFHVRKGLITGRKDNKRQKGVDVQLAVECLMHAYNKTIWHATIFAGDLDFQPLVAHLVNVGVHVHVYYESRSGARKLYQAADVAVAMKIKDFWEWSTPEFRKVNHIPSKGTMMPTPPFFAVKSGIWRDREIVLMRNETAPQTHKFGLELRGGRPGSTLRYSDHDNKRLVTYFELQHGPVQWEKTE